MSVKIELSKSLKQSELDESTTYNTLLSVIVDQTESELKWIRLHQMFDR